MNQIKHSIISWDCTFRNFFHLIDAFCAQEYNPKYFEIIYIEQRDRKIADEYNHRVGLKSLHDRFEEVRDKIQLRIEYLGDAIDVPYHLGRSVNKALSIARGDIISVMDGDLLLPSNFLNNLDKYYEKGVKIVNLIRVMANQPVGVPYEDWTSGEVDYKRCMSVCKKVNLPLTKYTDNKGPMISATRDAWEAINGYDRHKIWSTGLSRLGQDVTARMELYYNVKSTVLPDTIAVHPYHPMDFHRLTLDSVRILAIQNELIDYARKNQIVSWKKRTAFANAVYHKNKSFIKKIHLNSLSVKGLKSNAGKIKIGQSIFFGKAYAFCNKLLRKIRLCY